EHRKIWFVLGQLTDASNMQFAFSLLLSFTLLLVVDGKITGAPDELCSAREIVPNHESHKPREGRDAPFTITASASKFTSEKDTITVTIEAKGDIKFKGFAIGAKDATTKKLIGRWDDSPQAHSLACNSIVTHDNNDPKKSVALKWHPPKGTSSGNVVFSAAIVQSFSTFWKNVPVVVRTWGYPTGAPEEICNDPNLTPLHGKPPKDPNDEQPPFTVTASSATYQSNQKIDVIISGVNGVPLLGFAAAAENDKGEHIGSWQESKEVQEVKKCHVATHTNKNAKDSVHLVWKAPLGKKGNVHFVVTGLKTGYDYWTHLPSAFNFSPIMMILFLLLMITMPFVKSYPFGAPPGICTFDEPMPNHMAKSAQTTTLPFEISMSKDQVTSVDDSITVSIKSKPGGPTFKGFLVLPKDDNGPIGTWDNDETSHPIEGCSATTHDNKTPKDKVLLIWRPGTKLPKGRIRMTAVIVQQFDLFWINIPVPVQGSAVSSPQSTQNPISSSVTTPTTKIPPIGGVSLPGLVFTTVSTPPGSKVTKSSAQSEVITAGTVRQVEISTQKGNFNPETTTSGTTTTTTTSYNYQAQIID
uniref:Reelin domain-containing protein n=1 Tax=Strigamia maritima TaxID=126957 RepID=T1IVS0_STRMM